MTKVPLCNACTNSQLECTCEDDSLWDDSCDDVFVVVVGKKREIIQEKKVDESKEIDSLVGLVDEQAEKIRVKKAKYSIEYYKKNTEKCKKANKDLKRQHDRMLVATGRHAARMREWLKKKKQQKLDQVIKDKAIKEALEN